MANDQEAEKFYKEFWRKPGWSSADPNEDEKTRALIIMHLIKSKVNPFFKGKKLLKILDLGCGRGWLTNLLTHFGETTGTDPCQAAVERAKELFPVMDFRITTAEQLVAEGNNYKFDLIVSSEVIEHVIDQKSFMRSIQSLLGEGGFAIVTTPRGELRKYWIKNYPGYDQPIENWLTEPSLIALSRMAGLKVIRRERIFVPLRNNLMCRIAQSKKLSPLQAIFPISWFFRKIKYHYGLYQIFLLQKVS